MTGRRLLKEKDPAGIQRQPKSFYVCMRNMQSVKDNVTSLKKENGEMTTLDQETANLLSVGM